MNSKNARSWQTVAKKLKLKSVAPVRRDGAIKCFVDGHGRDFAFAGYSSETMLELIKANQILLKERDIYEEALVAAYTGCKTFHDQASMDDFSNLVSVADREKLRAAGASLPSQPPLTVYRGTGNEEATKSSRAWSWSLSLDVACKFAKSRTGQPVILQGTARDEDISFYVAEREEAEVVCRPQNVIRLSITNAEIDAGANRVLDAMVRRNKARLERIICSHRQSN